MINISVVVPIYNEEESVEPLFAAVVEGLEPTGLNFEVVCVDDGSTDESFSTLVNISKRDSRLKYVKLRKNAGQTAAMKAGIDHARGELIATMDGDLQNDPRDIPKLLDKMNEGYDLVVGWRINRQDKWLSRKLPSMIANWLIGKVMNLPIRDNGCSLKLYKSSIIKRVPLYSDMHRFIPAMTMTLGASIAEVGVRHHARQFGESKYGLSRIFKVILDLISIKTLILFSARPFHRFSGIASIAFAVSIFVALISLLSANSGNGVDSIVLGVIVLLIVFLSVFLILLGFIVTIAYRTIEISPIKFDTYNADI